ncbi:MAG: outer membrane beta-barrel protein [Paludibacteraceae bacterium]
MFFQQKVFIVPTVFLFSLFTLQAQHTIQTKIVEKETQKPLEFVAVRLLQMKDSSLVNGVTTDSAGTVRLQSIKNGTYILNATLVGFSNHYQIVTVRNADMQLPNVELSEDSKLLKELEVTGTQIQVVTKGDTIEYNAAAFKTSQNAVVEDLLRKMPGVEITAEGKIMVNGEEVKKIRVDGKKFFGDDVEMSTKNIPADMIDRVQVVDQKSEMAQLTGFDDGETERIINLTIRSDRRQGVFGNVQAGVGADLNPELRYDGNAFLNIMNNETRSSITAGANNTNTTRSRRGRGGFGGQRSGITATQNLGYNINTPLNDKLVIGGDVTFNHSDNLVKSDSKRENYLQDLIYQNNDSSTSSRENYEGNLRLEMEWKPDTVNTFIIQPNIGFNRSFSFRDSKYLYLQDNDSTSWGNTDNNGNGLDINGGLSLIYNRKMSKPGRTFTTHVNANISQGSDDGMNLSRRYTPDSATIVDQRSENHSNSFNFGVRVSFVEPLGKSKTHFLETALAFNGNLRNSTRELFDKDQSGLYNVKDTEYSNEFSNRFFRESLDINYRYVQPMYNLTLGVTAEPSQTYSTRIYDDTEIPLDNQVFNIAPSARFQYNFGKRNFVRLEYRGRTEQPSISQMQPVKNNTDLMNETVGNPTLNPAFEHRLRLMYSNYNSETFRSFAFGVFGNATKDDLTSNSIYDETGKRYVQTVNSDKIPYRLNAFFMYNQPFLKKFNFSNNTSFGVRQQYGYTSKNVSIDNIDLNNLMKGDLSSTKRYNASENLSVSYTHQIVDVALRGGVGYSNTKNNFNANTSETLDWTSALNLGLRPTENLTLTTDMNYTKQTGYADFNPSQWLWNASVDVNAFKGKGVVSLRVYDILRQRQNIIQNVGDNFVEFSRTNALPAYFLVSFTYKISKFNGVNSQEQQDLENMNQRRYGPPDGRSGPGSSGGSGRGGSPPPSPL